MNYQRCFVQLIFIFGVTGVKSLDTETLIDNISTGVTEASEEIVTSPPLEIGAELFINLEQKVTNGVVLDVKWDALDDVTEMYNYTIICRHNETGYQREYKGEAPSQHVAISLHKPSTTFACSIAALKRDEGGVVVIGPSTSFTV